MHTEFSRDSWYPMEELVQDAIDFGLEEICFTDHVDYGVNTGFQNCPYDEYFAEYERLKEKYADQITLKCGIEFGVQSHTHHLFSQDVQAYPFDFVILSLHQINDQEFWRQEYQENKSQREFHRGYYQELLDIVSVYKDYNVIGHMDIMRRYDQVGYLPFSEVKDLVEAVLKQVIADGKGIEINTSSHRYQLNDLTPAREILELYYELGGRVITVGSDSHKKEDVGEMVLESYEILKEIGFTHHCTFDKMEPIFHKL